MERRRLTNIPPFRSAKRTTRWPNWNDILNYVDSPECNGIRKNICRGCGHGSLYDKKNNSYPISKTQSLDDVKAIVATIKAIQ